MIRKFRKSNPKLPVWKYGMVKFPIEIGKSAHYYQNGFWLKTDPVERVIEKEADHVTFETKRYRYCFEFQKAENVALCMAA